MSKDTAAPAITFEKCTVIVLDVAGTTSSNSFIKDTLSPYVTKQGEEFLKEKWEDETVKAAVKQLKDDISDAEGAFKLLKELTEKEDSNEGLKTLQGLICKKGYESGDLKGHVFADVPAALESWSKARKVAIYSTGSVESQKQLFSHTVEGDLSKHISKYFDQSTGSKTESSSYEKVAKELETKAEEVLFITDSAEEGKAAKTAGMHVALVKREGNESLPEDAAKEFTVISSFKEISFENPSKRKNIEESAPAEVRSSKSRRHK
ncbi:unnamed protein product [Acanthoscelides obtectus]|uniref:Enolase-phosphatase E1 n=1 Tax=Acanthoscelides obtectus TaxID=200917 RepID=A0A9P0LW57_ACAOB|nr:unnamed protein product [Acanthoscelides obtectus]CAK1659552.1 Enolase-phosphatase E1 [Acanthoscelides obtectus]